MSLRRVAVVSLFGVMTNVGCFSPYGYHYPYGGPQGYGPPYYGNPTLPGGPVYTQPGTQPFGPSPYIPGQTPPSGTSPTPLNPPSTYDPRTPGNGGIGWEENNKDNNAAPFEQNPSDRGNVPNPEEESNPSTSRPELTPTSGAQRNDDGLQSPFEQTGNADQPRTSSFLNSEPSLQDAAELNFESPRKMGAAGVSSNSGIQLASFEAPQITTPQTTKSVSTESDGGSTLNPYGRDTRNANPTWLRGIIDYDTKQKQWSIIYSANPDQRDPNGGCLTLGPHQNLAKCRIGEVVLAEGAIDARQTDSRGKPLYALDKVTPLTR
ncbi:MAG: hypothetical protein FJ267_10780 [Planctomycetes bacterium]|nr:hypothetical protein [Planctomycetota bacterium]